MRVRMRMHGGLGLTGVGHAAVYSSEVLPFPLVHLLLHLVDASQVQGPQAALARGATGLGFHLLEALVQGQVVPHGVLPSIRCCLRGRHVCPVDASGDTHLVSLSLPGHTHTHACPGRTQGILFIKLGRREGRVGTAAHRSPWPVVCSWTTIPGLWECLFSSPNGQGLGETDAKGYGAAQ